MRKLIIMFALYLLHSGSFAQAHFDKVDYQKESRSSIVHDIPFSSATVEKAIDDAFAALGYKGTSSKGFTVYKGVRLIEIGEEAYDIYFMVDKKSRKDKDNSTVTMMLSKGFDEFLTVKSDEKVLDKARVYLDSLRNIVSVFDLKQQIAAQEDEVKKADKKNVSLQDELKDLEKRKRKLEDQIAGNMTDQQNQLTEIAKQKQILETLKAKLK